ncbi:unnamed protein product [Amoebophrya sp. A25]|nr:unnamed protein product [Amoebophrya sp. A25]|eukprot:GSA25T00011280001.1
MKVESDAMKSACSGLLSYIEKRNKDEQRKQLFDTNSETVRLDFSLASIPPKAIHKPYRITLPNPMYESSEVCVFVRDDLDDRNKKFHETKRKEWKNLVKSQNIKAVQKVMQLQKVKKEFKHFEQKRALCNSYDLFLCDKTILETMPQVLGKTFYKSRHKAPVPVTITKQRPSEDILSVLKSTTMTVPSGPCVGVRIGRCSMTPEQLAENCSAVCEKAASIFAEKGLEVKAAHITATDCISLPVYAQELDGDAIIVETSLKKATKQESKKEKVQSIADDATTAGNDSNSEDPEMKEAQAGRKGAVSQTKKAASAKSTDKKKVVEKSEMPLLKGRKKKVAAKGVKKQK